MSENKFQEKPGVLTLWFNKAKEFKTGKKFPAHFVMSEPLTVDQYHIYQSVENGGGFRAFPVYKKGTEEIINIKLEVVSKAFMEDQAKRRKEYLEWKKNNPKSAATEESGLTKAVANHVASSDNIDINF